MVASEVEPLQALPRSGALTEEQGDDDDDDDDDDDMSVADTAIDTKNMSDPEKARAYITKLKLPAILAGKALGRSSRHATETACKLEPKYKLELNTHLKLCLMAARLAPKQVTKQSKEELREAIQLLQGKIRKWPVPLQCTLFTKHISELVMNATAGFSQLQVQKLYGNLRPFPLPDAPVNLDLLNPMLCAVQVSSEKQAEMFLDILVVELTLPQLLEGEKKAPLVKMMTEELLASIESDMMQEIESESHVMALSVLQDHLRGLKALLSGDCNKLIEDANYVEILKDGSSEEPAQSLRPWSHAMQEIDYYKSKVEIFCRLMTSLKVHKPRLKFFQDYLAKEEIALDGKGVKGLIDNLRDLATLQEEVPAAAMVGLQEKMKVRLLEHWAAAKSKLDSEVEEIDIRGLQQALAEGTISFAGDGDVIKAQEEMSQMLPQQAGKGKTSKLMETFFKVAEEFAETSGHPTSVQHCLQAVKQAEGLPMTDEEVKGMVTKWDGVAHFMQELAVKDEVLVEFGKNGIVDLLSALLPWISGNRHAQDVACMKLALSMSEALLKYEAAGEVKDIIKRDAGKQKIAELVRWKKTLDEGVPGNWCKKFLYEQHKKSEKYIEEAAMAWMQQSKSALEQCQTKAAEQAGGGPSGSLWDKDIEPEAPWEVLAKKAEATLLELPIKILDEQLAALEQAQ